VIFWFYRILPSQKLSSLLSGDIDTAPSCVILQKQENKLILSDNSLALEYLADIMRHAQFQGSLARRYGVLFEGKVYFARFGFTKIGLMVPAAMDGIIVSPNWYSSIGDPEYYWVEFKKPIPEPLQSFLIMLTTAAKK
jgi:hypothetical protein